MRQTFLFALVIAMSCNVGDAQSKNKLEGAWRVIEITGGPNAKTMTHPQPGLWLFTRNHYSRMEILSEQPRPDAPDEPAKATGEVLNAAWAAFTGNTGTYEISGDMFTIQPIVAKNPQTMRPGNSATFAVRLDGDTLTLTMTKDVNGPVQILDAVKLIRVASGEPETKLQGAWRLTEVRRTGPNPVTKLNPQPGLMLFAGNYYGRMDVTSDQPRPDTPADRAKASGAELFAAWGPFTANSGTYELSGGTLTTHPVVAKSAQFMRPGNFNTYSYKLEGNTLWMTSVGTQNGAVKNSETVKMVRVE